MLVIAALWWSYFDVYAVLAQRQLSETSGATRAGSRATTTATYTCR
jgi:low temperature requirement protein LtrA